LALAQLEQAGYIKSIITQNIDMLHSRAGSQNVHEVHGNLRKATCIACYSEFEAGPLIARFLTNGQLPRCPKCQGVLKPNVVLFGEQLPAQTFLAAQQAARRCDVMLVAGSSLEVVPIGDLPVQAKRYGARLIIVDYRPTHVDRMAEVMLRADVADVLPHIAALVMEEA
jgi:NAD-dependent deacetylase